MQITKTMMIPNNTGAKLRSWEGWVGWLEEAWPLRRGVAAAVDWDRAMGSRFMRDSTTAAETDLFMGWGLVGGVVLEGGGVAFEPFKPFL